MSKTYTVSMKGSKDETLYVTLVENRRAVEGYSLNTTRESAMLSSTEATIAVGMLKAAGARPACELVEQGA
jgi:hypothetical protein